MIMRPVRVDRDSNNNLFICWRKDILIQKCKNSQIIISERSRRFEAKLQLDLQAALWVAEIMLKVSNEFHCIVFLGST